MDELEQYRRDLTGYCYRMLGSVFEAEDAVQDTLLRAWKAYDGFDGRSSVRTWLYRIATNVCLDHLDGRGRRALPMDLAPASTATATLGPALPGRSWVEPIPDALVLPTAADPAETTAARDTIRLAFVAALQHLPSRQRAVLILREVLRWSAAEVAELLATTPASVNSALQRARATLAERPVDAHQPPDVLGDTERVLLAQYVDAFERYDIDALVTLLHTDATHTMPPFPLWLRGPDEIRPWMLGPGRDCRGSRLIPTSANGTPAFGQYRPAAGGGHEPFALQVVELAGGRIVHLHYYLDTELFPAFGLPPRLDD